LSVLTFFAEKDPARFKGLNANITLAEINGKKPFAIVGGRPLQAAVAGQRHNVAALLLDKGASHKVLFPDGSTLLHLAAFLGDVKMAELLVMRGADVHARDRLGRTPLQVAAERDEEEVVALLKKHGGK
jgi:ankyrin repeat protein